MATHDTTHLESLRDQWLRQWPEALAAWSKFTKLSEPRWCFTPEDEKQQGMADSFAMIRLTDQAVVISLPRVQAAGVEQFAREILAHEIGHHVYCPGSLLDQGRILARIRRGLPTKEHLAPLIANLYADLLLNDRLQRDVGLDIAGVYRALVQGPGTRLWILYMRIYEILWSLPRGSLAEGIHDLPRVEEVESKPDSQPEKAAPIKIRREGNLADQLEGDAQLGARLIRSYAREWLDGAGMFAVLCLPYLLDDDGEGVRQRIKGWLDTEQSGH